jgi:hypothetical protein
MAKRKGSRPQADRDLKRPAGSFVETVSKALQERSWDAALGALQVSHAALMQGNAPCIQSMLFSHSA